MELVEGDDLSQVIVNGPMPLDDVLRIARQIAEALEAAHERGIIHRDLKPANIKVRPDGAVKVLDFGLAKGLDPVWTAPDGMQSPTFTGTFGGGRGGGATEIGLIIGTAAYMAPEQAKGKPADKRADIWAFGCVLFEMLTGGRAFPGQGISDTIAKVLEREPDWTAVPTRTPPHVRNVLERCLRKDPTRRLRDIGDARLLLEDGATLPVAAPVRASRSKWLVAAAIVVAVLAGTALSWSARWTPGGSLTERTPVHLDLLLPDDFELFTVAGSQLTVTPDGSKVAFVAVGGGARHLFVRSFDATTSVKLRGTESAVAGFFAPDGGSLGLLARDRTLKHLSLGDGLITDIGASLGTNAPVWGSDGFLVFARQGLWRLPVSGGTPTRLTTLDASRGEVAHTPGTVLPSGIVLFTSWNGHGDGARIEAVNPADGVRRLIVDQASAPVYASTGHLLFHRDGAVLAAPFDVRAAQLRGEGVMIFAPGVIRLSGGSPLMALSANGTLVYAPAQTGLANLVRVARDGAEQRLSEVPRPYTHPRVSPDGTRVVLEHAADSLWLHDLSRDARTPLTPGRLPGMGFPIWVRDGRRVVYRLFDELWWVDAGGSGNAERVPGGLTGDIPTALSPDGDTLVLLRTTVASGGDVFALSLKGAWPARPLVQTPGYDGGADFSPDGRWLVYASTDSGQSQIYLAPYPAMDRKWTVSTRGGTQARWGRTGREVFYRDGNRMMSVEIDVSGPDVRLSSPKQLFDQPFTSGAYVTTANYDVTADGAFVMLHAEPGVPRLTVILNFFEELRQKVGGR
jgi:serine/threonine-protein kinase